MKLIVGGLLVLSFAASVLAADQGKTWMRAGSLYWLTDDGLIVSADKGQTWKNLGPVKDAQYGPVFGQDDKHLFVLTKAGVVESGDRGATWSAPVAAPKDMKGLIGLGWLDYDPKGDSLYLMKMGSDLYRLPRR